MNSRMYTGLIGLLAGIVTLPAVGCRKVTWLVPLWFQSMPNRAAATLRSSMPQSRGFLRIRSRIFAAFDTLYGTAYGTTAQIGHHRNTGLPLRARVPPEAPAGRHFGWRFRPMMMQVSPSIMK